jgi:hypothetical protein
MYFLKRINLTFDAVGISLSLVLDLASLQMSSDFLILSILLQCE